MNRKILLTAFALVAVLLVAVWMVPVLADPAQKITFVAKQTPMGSMVVDQFTTPSGITHVDASAYGKITSWTGGEASVFLGATTSSVISINDNVNTAQGVIKFDMIWHLIGGTFEGNIVGDVDGVGPTAAYPSLHGVFQGTGDFAGQTIILDGNKPSGLPIAWTGTIVIP